MPFQLAVLFWLTTVAIANVFTPVITEQKIGVSLKSTLIKPISQNNPDKNK